MDSVGKTLIFAFLIMACAAHSARAADSQTIRVSCTIPAIPGVNCSLVEQQSRPVAAQQTAYAQPKERLDEPEGRQQEQQPGESRHEEQIETEESGHTVLVKTFYDR